MREAVIARIEEMIEFGGGRFGSRFGVLFQKVGKRRRRKPPLTREEIVASGYYPDDLDFSTLSDVELVEAFQKVCRRYYVWM